jgi:23S rRNA pseudouridine2605 synthase
MPKVRLQKLLQRAGIASRRGAEEMIQEGWVRVNGALVTQMGLRVDPDVDAIKVKDKLINPKLAERNLIYLAMYKPKGVICSGDDPEARKSCFDLLPNRFKNRDLTYAGRLDFQSEGLLILSNDGAFIYRCTHPKFQLTKTYLVKSRGKLSENHLEKLRTGIVVDQKRTLPAKVTAIPRKDTRHSWVQITLSEGRNQQLRKMFYAIGHGLIKLKRTAIGPIQLGNLKSGEIRELTRAEVQAVLKAQMAQHGQKLRGAHRNSSA